MAQQTLAKCFLTGGIMLIISMFANLVNIVNSYDAYIENNSSHVISAFDG